MKAQGGRLLGVSEQLYESDFKESEKSCKASGASVKHSEPAAAALNYFNTHAC